jgi:uridine kinase
MSQIKPFIIGIAGGTGSGKTTLARKIAEMLGDELVSLIDADSYYKDLSHLPHNQRHQINFDHPDALDTRLLIGHLKKIKQGLSIKKHAYDFAAHTRSEKTITLDPKPITVVEGILIFAIEELCRLFNLRIFVDEDADIRLLRRIQRDIKERGRSIEMVAEQYLQNVKPMHDKFVEPSKKKADIVMRPNDNAEDIIKMIREAALFPADHAVF